MKGPKKHPLFRCKPTPAWRVDAPVPNPDVVRYEARGYDATGAEVRCGHMHGRWEGAYYCKVKEPTKYTDIKDIYW